MSKIILSPIVLCLLVCHMTLNPSKLALHPLSAQGSPPVSHTYSYLLLLFNNSLYISSLCSSHLMISTFQLNPHRHSSKDCVSGIVLKVNLVLDIKKKTRIKCVLIQTAVRYWAALTRGCVTEDPCQQLWELTQALCSPVAGTSVVLAWQAGLREGR